MFFEHPILLIYLGLALGSVVATVTFWLWLSTRFSEIEGPASVATEELHQLRLGSFVAAAFQAAIFLAALAFSSVEPTRALPAVALLTFLAYVFQKIIASRVEKRLRNIDIPRLDLLALYGRAAMVLGGVYWGYVELGDWLRDTLGRMEVFQGWGEFIAMAVPLFLLIYASPVIFRWMLPCRPVDDPAALERLNAIFSRIGVRAPSFWLLGIDRFRSHNALIVGTNWGFGPFRPALFFTRSLLSELSPAEFEAVILHEASHVALGHVRKRVVGAFFSMILAMGTTVALFGLCSAWLSRQFWHLGALAAVLTSLFVFFALIRRIVRKQEIEADQNAVRLGASADAMASALRRLSQMNLMPTDKKDPFSFLNPAAAHPTADERSRFLNPRLFASMEQAPARRLGFLVPALGLLVLFALIQLFTDSIPRRAGRPERSIAGSE